MNGKEILQEMDARFMALAEERDQLRQENATLKAQLKEWQRLATDPVCTHQNILRGTVAYNRESALHYACAQDYDDLKAKLEQALQGQFHPDIVNGILAKADKVRTERDQLKAPQVPDSFIRAMNEAHEMELKQLKAQLDEAKAACGEMREVLQVFSKIVGETDNQEKLCLFQHGIVKAQHALSTSCGQHHIHTSELTPTIELAGGVIMFLNDYLEGHTHPGVSRMLDDWRTEQRRLKALQEKGSSK